MNPTTRFRKPRGAPVRQDGLETRRQLLEAGGQVFAEQGYARAKSKEICLRAQANVAAVNYHFGSKDALYAAVLEEAHQRLMSLNDLKAAAQSCIEPRLKLKALITRIAQEVTRRDKTAWEMRVLSRELLSQTTLWEQFLSNQVTPKAKLIHTILAEIMDLPADHPAVSRSALNIMGPFVLLLIANRTLLQKVAPKLNPDAASLAEYMFTYAIGGMQAVARKAR